MARKSADEETDTTEAEAVTEAVEAPVKNRRNAVIEDFDFSPGAVIDKSYRAKGKPRTSKWVAALSRLYDATAANKVPRGDNGDLQFVRVGNYTSRSGAQQQSKALKDAMGETYEFKVAVNPDGSAGLYARVREIPDPVGPAAA